MHLIINYNGHKSYVSTIKYIDGFIVHCVNDKRKTQLTREMNTKENAQAPIFRF